MFPSLYYSCFEREGIPSPTSLFEGTFLLATDDPLEEKGKTSHDCQQTRFRSQTALYITTKITCFLVTHTRSLRRACGADGEQPLQRRK